jgi:hypothetical protein
MRHSLSPTFELADRVVNDRIRRPGFGPVGIAFSSSLTAI